MRLDYQIIELHRAEGGAPDPKPLSEVPLPEMPKVTRLGLVPNALTPTLVKQIQPAPRPPPASTPDERLLLVFAAKHKLEVPRAKELIMVLDPRERRDVFLGFKPQDTAHALEELVEYIA